MLIEIVFAYYNVCVCHTFNCLIIGVYVLKDVGSFRLIANLVILGGSLEIAILRRYIQDAVLKESTNKPSY